MKATNGQKIRTGIFTIAGLFLLVGAIFLIGKTNNMFGNNFHIYATFKNVAGLQEGNNIRFVGINIGTVKNIEILSDTLAKVDMVINEKAHPFLKKDAVATIGSDGLMGDKLISIAATSDSGASTELIKNGGRIATVEAADFGVVLGKLAHVASNAEVITEQLAGIATQINAGKGSIGALLYSDKVAKNLEGSVSNLKQGTAGFSENMTALKHNFLLKGYYKKKQRKAAEAAEKAQGGAANDNPQPSKKEERKAARKAKKDANNADAK